MVSAFLSAVKVWQPILVQSDLIIMANNTTEYSTSDENFLGTDLFLPKLLPYNGNHTYRHRWSFLGTNLILKSDIVSLERQKSITQPIVYRNYATTKTVTLGVAKIQP